jgi:hypothetical protein
MGEISLSTNGRQAESEENVNIQPEKKMKHAVFTVKMEGASVILQEDGTDQEWPNP